MKDRSAEITAFIAQAGWGDAVKTPLQADFSTRHFMRLERTKDSPLRAILMDVDAGQNTTQFVAIAKLLRTLDIAAPEIYAEDASNGLVFMEDFGDRNVGRLIDAGADAAPFYRRAVDVLVRLHTGFKVSESNLRQRSSPLAGEDRWGVSSTRAEFSSRGENPTPVPALKGRGTPEEREFFKTLKTMDTPVFGGALLATQAELFLDAYFPFVKKREATIGEAEGFRAAWKQALKGIEALPQTLMLRDFMPDNLMDLQHRGIGVLDFQDGGIGPLPYDLASLCEAVRRDVGDTVLDDMIDYYHAQAAPSLSKSELRSACRVLAAQRHIRILGIVARLALNGRWEKLGYMPRIWKYLEQLLKDERLASVRIWVANTGLITK